MVSRKEKERYMSMIGQSGKRILHMYSDKLAWR